MNFGKSVNKAGTVIICLCLLSCAGCESATNATAKIEGSRQAVLEDREIDELVNKLGDWDKLSRNEAKSKIIQLLNGSGEKRKKVTDTLSQNISEICANWLSSERKLRNTLDILIETKPEETYDALARNVSCHGFVGGLSASRNPILYILPEFGDAIVPHVKNVLINGATEQRLDAAFVLSRIHSAEAKRVLEEAGEQEKDEMVRKNIRYCLQLQQSTT